MMLCSRCKQRPANVYFSQNINGNTCEYEVCSECAKELGLLQGNGSMFNLNHFFGDLFGGVQSISAAPSKACSHCGMTYREFANDGMFGCSHCYDAFSDQLPELMNRLHGAQRHIQPEQAEQNDKQSKIGRLKQEIQQAIEQEDYERAAQLRDEIKKLEQK